MCDVHGEMQVAWNAVGSASTCFDNDFDRLSCQNHTSPIGINMHFAVTITTGGTSNQLNLKDNVLLRILSFYGISSVISSIHTNARMLTSWPKLG